MASDLAVLRRGRHLDGNHRLVCDLRQVALMDQFEVLKSPFDIETHKATFINYLEVVVFPNGTICYAHPGHVEVMERVLALHGGNSDDCPRDMWCSYDEWLMEQTGCVCVWTGGFTGRPNERQLEALRMLVDAGLLRAERP